MHFLIISSRHQHMLFVLFFKTIDGFHRLLCTCADCEADLTNLWFSRLRCNVEELQISHWLPDQLRLAYAMGDIGLFSALVVAADRRSC